MNKWFDKICKNLLLLATIVFLSGNSFSQQISDLIQPLHVKAGETDTVLVSDIFYASSYKVKFHSDKYINVKYNKLKNEVILKPNKEFEGIDLLSFQFDQKEYCIPVISKIESKHTFIFKTDANPKKVNLFGTFNGWNRGNLNMNKTGDGIYKITIPIAPGRYQYKFFVDGNELIDKSNPVKVPNGMGSFNSVVIIPQRHKDKTFLHILNDKITQSNTILSFYYERENQPSTLIYSDISALINNEVIPSKNIQLNKNVITLKFNRDELKGKKVIRIAITQNGLTTNTQTVRLNNGIPEGSDKNITLQDQIIYSIMIDRFYDGDRTNDKLIRVPGLSYKANYQGGDLQGIIDKLNNGYFDSLGVNTLWISPVVDNPDSAYHESPPPHRLYTGYHGYWPLHLKKVEEHFGNMKLLKKLISIAHQHDIKVLFDFVSHHVFEDNILYKKHRDWFGKLLLPDGTKNLRLWDTHRLTTWFDPYLPTFNYLHSKAAINYMTNNAVWWLKETNADGFRHDAVKHVPNVFWRELTRKLKSEIEIPDHRTLYQIGETFGSYKLVSSYINNGQLNAQFNFNQYDVAIPTFIDSTASFKSLDREIHKGFTVFGYNNLMGNIMDSHDKVRFMAYADGDISLNSNDAAEIGWKNPPKVNHYSSYKKLKLYLSYLLTTPGIPVIDYGDEIGMTGAADPDNRRMMRFNNHITKWEKETLHDVRKIIHIRKDNSALRYGDFYTIQANKNDYVYLRSDMNERVLVVLNKSHSSRKLDINLPKIYKLKNAVNLLTNKKIKIINNKMVIDVPSIGYKFFKLN